MELNLIIHQIFARTETMVSSCVANRVGSASNTLKTSIPHFLGKDGYLNTRELLLSQSLRCQLFYSLLFRGR